MPLLTPDDFALKIEHFRQSRLKHQRLMAFIIRIMVWWMGAFWIFYAANRGGFPFWFQHLMFGYWLHQWWFRPYELARYVGQDCAGSYRCEEVR